MIDAALDYAARGWPVFPCWPRSKTPLVKHGVDDATADPEQIGRWWRRWSEANVAIAVGASGLLVLDRDQRNGGDDTVRRLVAELGPLPTTVTSITGSGGGHALFRWRGDPEQTLSRLGPGVDVQRGGKYIVAPPSVHPNGERYRWRPGRSPDDVEVAELPSTWLARIARPPAPPMPTRSTTTTADDPDRVRRRAAAYLRRLPPAISGSHGHTTTYRAAVAMVRGFGLDERDAFELLANDYNPTCSPPWSERELARKVREALRARVPHGYLLEARP